MLAPAKVNLFLHVDRVKPNGRHDLDSLVVFAGAEAADRLEARQSSQMSFVVSGPYASSDLEGVDNLVLKAVAACEARGLHVPPLSITLTKNLPVAGGIGGGSADAGAMLRMLVKLGSLTPPVALRIAAELGGDVPVAFLSEPRLMRGEGERLETAGAVPDLHAVLVNPGAPCPTGPVFKAYDSAGGGNGFDLVSLPEFGSAAALCDWLNSETRNDLEAPAIDLVPVISDALNQMREREGCLLARMSGSGATCFAIFDTMRTARAAESELLAARPDWWVKATTLHGNRGR